MQKPAVVVAALIEQDGCFLVTRRLEGSHLEGYWEFPGGKCDPGENHEDCLRRELREELGVSAAIGKWIWSTVHQYPHRPLELHFYRCDLEEAPRPQLGQQIRWVPKTELASLQFPPADTELIAQLTTDAR